MVVWITPEGVMKMQDGVCVRQTKYVRGVYEYKKDGVFNATVACRACTFGSGGRGERHPCLRRADGVRYDAILAPLAEEFQKASGTLYVTDADLDSGAMVRFERRPRARVRANC